MDPDQTLRYYTPRVYSIFQSSPSWFRSWREHRWYKKSPGSQLLYNFPHGRKHCRDSRIYLCHPFSPEKCSQYWFYLWFWVPMMTDQGAPLLKIEVVQSACLEILWA